MTHITTLSMRSALEAAPGLRYHKLHAYDALAGEKAFKSAQALNELLEDVIRQCAGPVIAEQYARFHQRFAKAIDALDHSHMISVTMDWRTVVGWGTNPALESGIALHPILGVPYIPGSAVKGLIHACAESELIDGAHPLPAAPHRLPDTAPPELLDAIDYAMRIRRLFGSLTSESLPESGAAAGPRARFEGWLKLLPERVPAAWQGIAPRLEVLAATDGTGGRLRFYDAMLTESALASGNSPLEIDILNVHYHEYYRDAQKAPEKRSKLPTDDMNPVPVKFLVLKAGSELEFRFRHEPYVQRAGDGSSATVEWAGFNGFDANQVANQVEGWLIAALTERGIGAKTAAGYGYARASDAGVAAVKIEDPAKLADMIDKAMKSNDNEASAALAAGIWSNTEALTVIEGWRTKMKPAIKKRIAWFDTQPRPAGGTRLARVASVAVRQVAPAMIGGVNPQECDLPATLRPPSIRGHLRFWTRALAGGAYHEAEAALWGSTDLGQRVSLISASRAEPAREFVSGFALPLPMIPPGKNHTLKFRVAEAIAADQTLQDRLGAVLWVWLHLGALGRRARRGYGSLQWIPKDGDLVARWLQADRSAPFASRDSLETYLRAGLTQALDTFAAGDADGPRQASPYFRLTTLDQVFVGRAIPLKYAERKGREETVLQDIVKGVRHEPGKGKIRSPDPVEQRQLGYITEGSDTRLASPMLWRVLQLNSGDYVPVMTWSPHIDGRHERPDDVVRLSPGTTMYEHLTEHLGFDRSLAGGTLEGPAND